MAMVGDDFDDDPVILSGITIIMVGDDPEHGAFVQRSRQMIRDPRLSSPLTETRSAIHALALSLVPEKTARCTCKLHKGTRKLPIAAFAPDAQRASGHDDFCLHCRALMNYERRHRLDSVIVVPQTT